MDGVFVYNGLVVNVYIVVNGGSCLFKGVMYYCFVLNVYFVVYMDIVDIVVYYSLKLDIIVIIYYCIIDNSCVFC